MNDFIKFVSRNFLKNRTIVTSDVRGILQDVADTCGLPLKLHRFPSGVDVGTWIIPPRWDIKEAWLKGPDGKKIASYEDHPLFVAPYSIPFEGTLTLSELKKHIRCPPTQVDAYYYEHRLAYDYQRRLKEWIITLPKNVLDRLSEGNYQIKIEVDTSPGEMLVGEIILPGESDDSIALLSDYCHPGQVNDSFSGIVAQMGAIRRLKELRQRHYTYRFFIFPETIGSCALLASQPSLAGSIKAAIFSEFVGWGEKWLVAVSNKPGSLAMHMARESKAHYNDIEVVGLFDGWGNDECVFDYAGIPSLSVQKFDCPEYHSSNDNLDKLNPDNLARASEIIFRMCNAAENDRIYRPKYNVPIYMTRYNLYLDAVNERSAFKQRREILYGLDGRNSLLQIAANRGIDFDQVKLFADSLHKLELLEETGNRPEYKL